MYPALLSQLIGVGEDAGQLRTFLLKAAEIFEERTERATQRLAALAEPAMIVMFGAIVAFVALSLLQTWIIIELFFMIGTDGANRFGLDPTRTAADFPVDSRPGPAGVPDFLKRRAGGDIDCAVLSGG